MKIIHLLALSIGPVLIIYNLILKYYKVRKNKKKRELKSKRINDNLKHLNDYKIKF